MKKLLISLLVLVVALAASPATASHPLPDSYLPTQAMKQAIRGQPIRVAFLTNSVDNPWGPWLANLVFNKTRWRDASVVPVLYLGGDADVVITYRAYELGKSPCAVAHRDVVIINVACARVSVGGACHIYIDAASWAVPYWDVGTFYTALSHELGHCVGLADHVYFIESIMSYAYIGTVKVWVDPTALDLAAVRGLLWHYALTLND